VSAIVSSDPLRALIRRAMGSSPDSGTLARYRVRADSAGSGQVVLADVSGSMAEDAWGGRRKVEVLRGALEQEERREPVREHIRECDHRRPVRS
jgi:uncharacterized protein with von Willebrand factor type A (vWA) domain